MVSANGELMRLFWEIGFLIATKQEQEGWGTGVIPKLAVDLKKALPREKGYSERNLKRMLRFYREYPMLAVKVPLSESRPKGPENQDIPIVPQSAAQLDISYGADEMILCIPWFHNVVLMEKIKDATIRTWYARQVLEFGWSRTTLVTQIKQRAHERVGTATTNFKVTLPSGQAGIAQGLLKDPYLFDFLTLTEPFVERELESGLIGHIQKFLIELGRGFAFVGSQFPLTVSGRKFYLDLLFYHLELRCFIIIDLKKDDFKPEYAGKMNFYCSAVDTQLRHHGDTPTIGLILCQTKDCILAEYSLKGIDKPIGVAGYELTRILPSRYSTSLPSIEVIESELGRK